MVVLKIDVNNLAPTLPKTKTAIQITANISTDSRQSGWVLLTGLFEDNLHRSSSTLFLSNDCVYNQMS